MDWIDLTTMEPVLQQTTAVPEASQLTNPSSFTLAVIGLLTYLAVDIVRRSVSHTRPPRTPETPKVPQGIRPRRAA